VAWMFPPFRCKSQSSVRRSTCGNICCILSTAVSLACSRASRDWRVCAAAGAAGRDEKKSHRTIRPETRRMPKRYGREICSFAMARRGLRVCARASPFLRGFRTVCRRATPRWRSQRTEMTAARPWEGGGE
jgi:hypothetical protein